MDNLFLSSRLTRGAVIAVLGFCVSLMINPSLQAADVEERDIKVEASEANRAEHQAGQAWQQETKAVEYESAETEALGEMVASQDESSAAAEAKGDFATGFKSVGRGFKNGTKATGRAFKTAGTTMGKGFKKAGSGIKWFFTGKWLGKGDGESESYAESEGAFEAQSDLENVESDTGSDDDLELDFDKKDKSESNDWA